MFVRAAPSSSTDELLPTNTSFPVGMTVGVCVTAVVGIAALLIVFKHRQFLLRCVFDCFGRVRSLAWSCATKCSNALRSFALWFVEACKETFTDIFHWMTLPEPHTSSLSKFGLFGSCTYYFYPTSLKESASLVIILFIGLIEYNRRSKNNSFFLVVTFRLGGQLVWLVAFGLMGASGSYDEDCKLLFKMLCFPDIASMFLAVCCSVTEAQPNEERASSKSSQSNVPTFQLSKKWVISLILCFESCLLSVSGWCLCRKNIEFLPELFLSTLVASSVMGRACWVLSKHDEACQAVILNLVPSLVLGFLGAPVFTVWSFSLKDSNSIQVVAFSSIVSLLVIGGGGAKLLTKCCASEPVDRSPSEEGTKHPDQMISDEETT